MEKLIILKIKWSASLSAKPSNPKKTGGVTKTTPAPSSAPRSRAAKDGGGGATQSTGTGTTRTNQRKKTSTLPPKASPETASLPGEPQGAASSKPATLPRAERRRGDKDPCSGPAPLKTKGKTPKAGAAASGLRASAGLGAGSVERAVGTPRVNSATEETSFTAGRVPEGSAQEKEAEGGSGEGGGGAEGGEGKPATADSPAQKKPM